MAFIEREDMRICGDDITDHMRFKNLPQHIISTHWLVSCFPLIFREIKKEETSLSVKKFAFLF